MNVGEMQRLLSVQAERHPGHRFRDLYSLLGDTDWLRLAHDHVAQNAGRETAGCDGVTMTEFDADLEGNLTRLQGALKAGTFDACPVRRVNIPKPNGKMRPLGIPSIRDRIVQEAVRMALEPIYETDFTQNSYGFRPNRCTMDAIKRLICSTGERGKFFWVVEGDIAAYFDTVHHRRLIELLRRRVADAKLLDLIWKFLRAGVMERKLFKGTKLGVPQGGIVSPLLANVYLHELDKYVQRYTAAPAAEKRRRRRNGLANLIYVRYADDFVVLCNGTKGQAMALRSELHEFLTRSLKLTLSLEKTKVTHLNDGFDFLGFQMRRRMGGKKMGVRTTISEKALNRHLDYLKAATAPGTHEDSFALKVLALNRAIAGWCRYFQHTDYVRRRFHLLEHETYWLVTRWLARKHGLSIAETLRRYSQGGTLGEGEVRLIGHGSYTPRNYTKRFIKPNPYTTREVIEREELPVSSPWTGYERRPGMADLRPLVMERDGHRCCLCGDPVEWSTCEVDHVRPVRTFKRPVDANSLGNLWTLCIRCHQEKTEYDRQRESRML